MRFRSTSAITLANSLGCSCENIDVQPWRPVAHVIDIEPNTFLVGETIAAGNLPQTGDAGFDSPIVYEIFLIAADFLLHDRSGADKAHLACEHVPKLRQFIETCFAEKPPDGGYSRVVRELLTRIPF